MHDVQLGTTILFEFEWCSRLKQHITVNSSNVRVQYHHNTRLYLTVKSDSWISPCCEDPRLCWVKKTVSYSCDEEIIKCERTNFQLSMPAIWYHEHIQQKQENKLQLIIKHDCLGQNWISQFLRSLAGIGANWNPLSGYTMPRLR